MSSTTVSSFFKVLVLHLEFMDDPEIINTNTTYIWQHQPGKKISIAK